MLEQTHPPLPRALYRVASVDRGTTWLVRGEPTETEWRVVLVLQGIAGAGAPRAMLLLTQAHDKPAPDYELGSTLHLDPRLLQAED